MANVVRLRLRGDPEEEAAAWIARIDKGLSSDDEARLAEWLAEDARHRRAFQRLAALWDEAETLAQLAELFPLDRSAPRRRRYRHYAIAAMVLVAVAGSLLGVGWRGAPWRAETQAYTARLETPVGEWLTEQMPDGSRIMLNTDTEIGVDYSARRRALFLRRGEAHFDVAPDADRPFDVHAGSRVVRAVGTAFTVRLDAERGLEVTVTEGEVRLGAAAAAEGADDGASPEPAISGAATKVGVGEVAVVDPADRTAPAQVQRLEPVDLDIKLAWQRGMLVFRGEPLDVMLREVGRYTTVRFELADPELAEVRVGGYFRAGDVEGLLAALQENLGIESERLAGDRIALHAAD